MRFPHYECSGPMRSGVNLELSLRLENILNAFIRVDLNASDMICITYVMHFAG
jgi:hypothetical protein